MHALVTGQAVDSPLPQPFAVSNHHPKALFFPLTSLFHRPSSFTFHLHAPFYFISCEFLSWPFPFSFRFLLLLQAVLHSSGHLLYHLHDPDNQSYVPHPTYFTVHFRPVFPIQQPHPRHSEPPPRRRVMGPRKVPGLWEQACLHTHSPSRVGQPGTGFQGHGVW